MGEKAFILLKIEDIKKYNMIIKLIKFKNDLLRKLRKFSKFKEILKIFEKFEKKFQILKKFS